MMGRDNHPKLVEQFTDVNKLHIVACGWTIIDTNFSSHLLHKSVKNTIQLRSYGSCVCVCVCEI
jgi:hypothetical protein